MITVAQAIIGFLLNGCHFLARCMMVIACLFYASLVLMVFAGSIMRYLVGTPLAIADETASLLFLSGALLTLSYGYLEKKLIRISLIWDALSAKWKFIADIVGTLVGAVVVFIVSRATFAFAWDAYELGTRTTMTDVPVWPWAMTIPVSLGLLALAMALTAFRDLLNIFSDERKPVENGP